MTMTGTPDFIKVYVTLKIVLKTCTNYYHHGTHLDPTTFIIHLAFLVFTNVTCLNNNLQ